MQVECSSALTAPHGAEVPRLQQLSLVAGIGRSGVFCLSTLQSQFPNPL